MRPGAPSHGDWLLRAHCQSVRKQNLKSLIYFGIQINVKESGMATLEILFWKVPERLCACAVSGCGVVLLRTAGQVSW